MSDKHREVTRSLQGIEKSHAFALSFDVVYMCRSPRFETFQPLTQVHAFQQICLMLEPGLQAGFCAYIVDTKLFGKYIQDKQK